MELGLVTENLLNPPILFFLLGGAAALLRSDLEIPKPLPKVLSLYLLLAIGFHGGYELHQSGIDARVMLTLGASALMAVVVPLYSFWILRLRLGLHDAAAIAATYGSISAVTFVTAVSFLNAIGVSYGGHMVAAMALMESPAIVVGVLLLRLAGGGEAEGDEEAFDWKELFREAFLNGAVFLLVGSLLIGLATGESGWEAMKPFTDEMFKGVLAFFLLDMGLLAARRVDDLRKAGGFLVLFAILMPLFNAAVAIGLSTLLGFTPGDSLLFTVLVASASYIAVPAAMRISVPQANPTYYIATSLGVTFPFNIVVGIPLYYYFIRLVSG